MQNLKGLSLPFGLFLFHKKKTIPAPNVVPKKGISNPITSSIRPPLTNNIVLPFLCNIIYYSSMQYIVNINSIIICHFNKVFNFWYHCNSITIYSKLYSLYHVLFLPYICFLQVFKITLQIISFFVFISISILD